MHNPFDRDDGPLRIGSLFSGYGGLDLAVEHVFNAETVWFSELNEPVARVFAHHWPDTPNLGDITTIDWHEVEPVDIPTGGLPCQSVSTVGKRAGLAPGAASGLWSHMGVAIEALQPKLVVIENVRGLLSTPAQRSAPEGTDHEQRNPANATPKHDAAATLRDLEPDPWHLGDDTARPLRAAGAVLGDLVDLRRDTRWVGLPASLIGAPHHRFRIFILSHPQDPVPHPTRLGLLPRRRDPGTRASKTGHDCAVAPDHRPRPARTQWLAEQERRVPDPVVADRGHLRRWGRYADAIASWEHITGRTAPAPALLSEDAGPRPSPKFVEWLMGLPPGWVSDVRHGLTANQQIAALGNGVLPVQAVQALNYLRASHWQTLWAHRQPGMCR
ncbi:DNA cytosine methyltransferase [Brevibacterium picturae]|uniref:DNA (cytosine-5-)-methyltransferase n=1 Tax=Brevibacterium picturae TaxID=260553 RepID=A0ABP4NI26_9MICO